MEPFYRATLRLERVEPYTDKYDNISQRGIELSAHTVTGDTPDDAMVQMCAHADSLYDWHIQQADDDEPSPEPVTHVTLDAEHPVAQAFRRIFAPLNRPAETPAEAKPNRPTIVVLCGSTRFSKAFREANLRETLAGRIVLSIGCDMRTDTELFETWTNEQIEHVKAELDELHKRKIDLADEVLVLNVGGYIGDSTRSEIDYAISHGKRLRWLEPGHEDTPERLADWERNLLEANAGRGFDATPNMAPRPPIQPADETGPMLAADPPIQGAVSGATHPDTDPAQARLDELRHYDEVGADEPMPPAVRYHAA